MMRMHVNDRILAEANERDRLDRIGRILQVLEAGDGPRFSFYAHEHRAEWAESSVASGPLDVGNRGHQKRHHQA